MANKNNGMIYVSAESAEVQDIDEYMTVYEFFGKQDIDGASFVTAELDGPHSTRVNHRSEKTYFVISGSIELTVKDETKNLTEGDAAVVPPNNSHSIIGNNARIMMVSSPPYDPADEDIA